MALTFEQIVKENKTQTSENLDASKLSQEELNNFEIAKKYIENNSDNYIHFSDKLKSNLEIIRLSMKGDSENIQYLPKHFQKDEKLLLQLHKEFLFSLEHLNEDLLSNKQFIHDLLSNSKGLFDVEDLKFLAPEILKDEKLMNLAIEIDPFSLEYMSDELKNNKEIVLKAVLKNGFSIQFASDKLKSNKEIVSKAVEKNGLSLIHISDQKLLSDLDIALIGLSNFEDTIEYMNPELHQHPKIINHFSKNEK